jgi:hypothetical protein
LISEVQLQTASSSRHRSHNEVLQAEVSRLTSESRQLRASLGDAARANEASQLEILELTARNESLNSQLHDKFSKVPGAQGRRLMESQEHLIQCNRARKEAARQISSLRYIIGHSGAGAVGQLGLAGELQRASQGPTGTPEETETSAAAGPSTGVRDKHEEFLAAVQKAKQVQALLQSLL